MALLDQWHQFLLQTAHARLMLGLLMFYSCDRGVLPCSDSDTFGSNVGLLCKVLQTLP